jgi:hypothetical protein
VTFALPHWLFWAAMCLRELDDHSGLAGILSVLSAVRPSGNNLALQTAAVAGGVAYLRAVKPLGIVKPGNLALALMEAGLIDEFDSLRAAGAFSGPELADTTKRYAWALARRGDFDAALEVTATIHRDMEEQARALFRIAHTALADGKVVALRHVAEAASALRAGLTELAAQPERTRLPRNAVAKSGPPSKHTPSPSLEPWRVESWLAGVMLAADRLEDAAALAESVCGAGIVPSSATSLAMATPHKAYAKGHVRLDSASGPDEGLLELVLQIAAANGTSAALQHPQMQGATARTRATILAQLARVESDSGQAFSLWLDAIIASRTAGRATLDAVIADGERLITRAGIGETPASLFSQLGKIDAEFGA